MSSTLLKRVSAALISAAVGITALTSCTGNTPSDTDLPDTDGTGGNNSAVTEEAVDTPAEPVLVASAEDMDIMEYVAAMQPGWNLGNTLDATGGETSWGNPMITQELISAIKAQGFNSIRIPITWFHAMDGDNNIRADYLERTKEVIQMAIDADLLVLVNVHHDSWSWLNKMTPDDTENFEKFKAIWRQLAEAYKDFPRAVMFESINEPQFDNGGKAGECLDMLNKAMVEIVRASGGNNATRPIVLPTLNTNGEQKYLDALNQTIADIGDDNIIATIHYYGYWPFSVNVAGETEFGQLTTDELNNTFDHVKATFIDNGIPVIIGEWGLLGFDTALDTVEHGEILKYFEYITNYARETGATLMWWDNGQHFDRTSLQWGDPSLHAIIIQGLTGRSSYAERDFINIREGEAEDKTLALTLNGNTLTGVRTEAGAVAESSYSVSGDSITFTKDYIGSLITDPAKYGKLETLYLDFSSGPSWTIYVYNTSTPVLSDAKGSIVGLTINTEFNGTQLKTMEAEYVSGGNGFPGGQNWTAFKQYGEMFTARYIFNEIKIEGGFFSESSKNCEILLKFYFWNGDVVEYNLTVADGKVTGTASGSSASADDSQAA